MGKKYALLMGLNYSNIRRSELYGCINDMNLTRNMLIDAYGYQEENMYIFRDDFDNEKRFPTKANIVNMLTTLCSTLNEEDELWVHYSGHGAYFDDYGINETDNRDEYLLVYDNNNRGRLVALIDDEFNAILKNSKCKIIMVIDACNTGTIGDLPWNFKYDGEISRNNKLVRRSMENDIPMSNSNITIYSSARDDELAADAYNPIMQLPMGALTMAILYCLRRSNHNISCMKLYTDICEFMVESGYEQRPQLTTSVKMPSVYISRNENNIQFMENDVIVEEIVESNVERSTIIIQDSIGDAKRNYSSTVSTSSNTLHVNNKNSKNSNININNVINNTNNRFKMKFFI